MYSINIVRKTKTWRIITGSGYKHVLLAIVEPTDFSPLAGKVLYGVASQALECQKSILPNLYCITRSALKAPTETHTRQTNQFELYLAYVIFNAHFL